ncbi:MAG: hypothetical protein LR015_01630, partial [Verrucomicrobia bacterium]|nr:hypothetical protein [Verrucomicrobiota bacterium]
MADQLRREFPQALRQPGLRTAVTQLRDWRTQQEALAEAAAALTRTNRSTPPEPPAPATSPNEPPPEETLVAAET